VWGVSSALGHASERRIAIKVVVVAVLAGIFWVLGTDLLIYSLTHTPRIVALLETAEGFTFVMVTAAILYWVTLRGTRRVLRALATTHAVVDSIGDGVLILGLDRRILYANPAAVRMLHARHAGELVGMGAAEFSRRFRVSYPSGCLVPPDEYVSQRVFDEGGPLRYKAVLHPSRDGDLVILSTAAAVREEVGAPAELVVSVMHDVTELDRLDQLRTEFVEAAAHELKTPVAVIKGRAQLLSEAVGARLGPSIAAIERQCGRMERLVQNLLVLTRIRSDTLQLYPTEVELAPLVERVARQMAAASMEHDVRTEMAAAPRAHADPERLAIAVRNEIEDALRLAPPGTPVIVRLSQSGRDARIGVGHRAPGEPEAVFEETIHQDRAEGDLGVNRHVSAAIVAGHGGTLREERMGEEMTTWIRLPAITTELHGHA